jgi:23S rRNA pseudouridine2605 synthase
MEERLQKIIARAGWASRRRAEEMIRSGLVTVNGRVVTELGTKADENQDHIKVGGKLLRPEPARVYYLLHKPPEVVSTLSDPEGRPSLRDLLHGIPERVYPVGRLEYHSTGLVFLTSDGDLANRMLKARHLPQTYQMKLKTLLTFQEIEALARRTGAHISRLRGTEAPWYEVTLAEARSDRESPPAHGRRAGRPENGSRPAWRVAGFGSGSKDRRTQGARAKAPARFPQPLEVDFFFFPGFPVLSVSSQGACPEAGPIERHARLRAQFWRAPGAGRGERVCENTNR